MGWFSSLFAPSNTNVRRGQALHSTHDAFSLPTSSPTSRHPDAFNPESLSSPGPESLMSPSYSYPPQGTYGYIPTSTGRSSGGNLLPMHHDPSTTSGPSGYPPLAHTWKRLQLWLAREYPELGDTLNYGILPDDLANLEMQFGFALPPAVRESYLAVDGQEAESSAGCSEGLFFGLMLLPLDVVLDEWRFWREVDDDPTTGANPRLLESMHSIPPGWVRHQYSQRGWIPLIADKTGNYIGVDVNPGEGGASGQVIVFGREFDTKVVLWRGDGPGGWGKWLASFVEELEAGDTYEMGSGTESEGSEDGVGYESYYHDGTGGGQGDGGGDSSARVGLRLTGEYRGWSVMEAWADRSVRRWFQAGVISEADMQVTDKSQSQSNGPGPVSTEKAAEVAIPVLTDAESSSPGASTSKPRLDVPTISVTKPPAPLPVALPTPKDIQPLPSPPDSIQISYADDEESALPEEHPNRRQSGHSGSNSTSNAAAVANMSRLPTPPPSADDVRNLPPQPAGSTSPSTSPHKEETLVEIGSPEPVSHDLLGNIDSPRTLPAKIPPPISVAAPQHAKSGSTVATPTAATTAAATAGVGVVATGAVAAAATAALVDTTSGDDAEEEDDDDDDDEEEDGEEEDDDDEEDDEEEEGEGEDDDDEEDDEDEDDDDEEEEEEEDAAPDTTVRLVGTASTTPTQVTNDTAQDDEPSEVDEGLSLDPTQKKTHAGLTKFGLGQRS